MQEDEPKGGGAKQRQGLTSDTLVLEEEWELMKAVRYASLSVVFVALLGFGFWQFLPSAARADRGNDNGVPRYVVDPFWPKQLPNNWLIGQVGGLATDSHDHVWIIQRPRTLTDDEAGAVPFGTRLTPRSECCVPAPSVMEFDGKGNLLRAWGGPADKDTNNQYNKTCKAPACQWPNTEHGILVDKHDNVWVAGNGGAAGGQGEDDQILKFAADGTFLFQIGKAGASTGNGDLINVKRPADFDVDVDAHELYVADGYGNKRIAVFDTEAPGPVKRYWGAYGKPPCESPGNPLPCTGGPYNPKAPTDKDFRNPVHCVRLVADLVYVCDRVNDRIQVFTKAGKFVQEFFEKTETLGNGSMWDIAPSLDRNRTFLHVTDGENNHVYQMRRLTGEIAGQFGHNGRNAGQFHWIHVLDIDSNGTIYTGEVDTGKRIQRFVPAGDSARDDRD